MVIGYKYPPHRYLGPFGTVSLKWEMEQDFLWIPLHANRRKVGGPNMSFEGFRV